MLHLSGRRRQHTRPSPGRQEAPFSFPATATGSLQTMPGPDPGREEAERAATEAARIGGTTSFEPQGQHQLDEAQRPLGEADRERSSERDDGRG